jgi:SAM-dependent methyltransferase
MFKNFPKQRPPLPAAIQAIYSSQYKSNRNGSTTAASLAQRMEEWLHRKVASDVGSPNDAYKVTLELGAGTLNQLKYEPNLITYDIVEPFRDLFRDSPSLSRIRNVFADISEIPCSPGYDRITSVAVLEHVCNLPEVIAKAGLLLNPNGVFRASIPNEGTFLWTLGWKLTTGLEFKLKHGLDYGILMKHEHVNTADEIEQVLKHFFKDVSCKVFGVCKGIALYRYFECKNPQLGLCNEFPSSSR